jgi:transcriptional regulator with XRE-family HTH domain
MNAKDIPQKSKKVHHGQNVKRFREMQGIKQDTLALKLGTNQQQISRLEAKEILEEEMLDKLSKALHVTVDAIKNWDEDKVVNIISNTFNEQSVAYQNNFNPIEKILALHEEQIELYKSMLKAEQEKYTLLEKMLLEQRKQ